MIKGFFYPFRGARLIFSSPPLMLLVAFPVAVNTALYALFGWYAFSRFGGWVDSLAMNGDAWYWVILHYLLIVLISLILIVFIFYTFTIVGNLILAPFNDLISERVERFEEGRTTASESFSLSSFVRDMGRSYKAEGGRILLYLGAFVVLLPLNLIPLAGNMLYGFLALVCSFFFLCWEFLDYSMERARFTFSEKRGLAFRNFFVFISFGAGSALLLFVPFLNLAMIPACVAGATLLFSDIRK